MTIESRSEDSGIYSVECNTCFNPFSDESVLLVSPGQGLGYKRAYKLARLHEKDEGSDHHLVLEKWEISDKSLIPQEQTDDSREPSSIEFGRGIEAAGRRLNGSYFNIKQEEYDMLVLPEDAEDNSQRTLSLTLAPDDVDNCPQSVSYLLDKLGISSSDGIKVWLKLFHYDQFTWMIEPEKITAEKTGVIFRSDGSIWVLISKNQSVETHLLEYINEDTPQKAKDIAEIYGNENRRYNCSAPFASTLVDGAHWMATLIEKRRKKPQERIVYDIENGFAVNP